MLFPDRKRKSTRGAFTLVEMLVVVAIILALAAIAVPITLSVLDASKRDIAKSQCKGVLSQAVLSYKLDDDISGGSLPGTWDDVLKSPKAGLTPQSIVDPFGRQYHLDVPSQHNNPNGFDVWSDCGGSGQQVGNW
jgi:prepilin-type N-terminal cleavage/methylation domain-containing protein